MPTCCARQWGGWQLPRRRLQSAGCSRWQPAGACGSDKCRVIHRLEGFQVEMGRLAAGHQMQCWVGAPPAPPATSGTAPPDDFPIQNPSG
jgi:hypothetical protein